MLNYQKLLMPYKNFKGEHMIVYAFVHNRSYKLSDQASTITNLIDTYQLDADKKEKISAICYMCKSQYKNVGLGQYKNVGFPTFLYCLFSLHLL